jgi:hypothetical protein
MSRIGTFWIQWREPRSEDRYDLQEIVRDISALRVSLFEKLEYTYTMTPFSRFPFSQNVFFI